MRIRGLVGGGAFVLLLGGLAALHMTALHMAAVRDAPAATPSGAPFAPADPAPRGATVRGSSTAPATASPSALLGAEAAVSGEAVLWPEYEDADGGAPLLQPAIAARALPAMPARPTLSALTARSTVELDAGDSSGLPPLQGLWTPRLLNPEAPRASQPHLGVLIVVGGTSAGVAGPCRRGHRVTDRQLGLFNALAAVLPQSEVVSVLQFSYRVKGWHGIEQSRRDMNAALRWVTAQLADEVASVPIGLLGHSMGAAVVLPPESSPLTTPIAAVATLAGVSKQIAEAIPPALELLVLHDPADQNVAVESAAEIYRRHSGGGAGHKRLRYVRVSGAESAPMRLMPAAAHNFEEGDACASVVWPEILGWVRRWRRRPQRR